MSDNTIGKSNWSTAPETEHTSMSEPDLRSSWRRFRRNRIAMTSAWFLFLLVAIVLAWPIALKIASGVGPQGKAFAEAHQPEQLSDAQFQRPNLQHWLGTDVHGRDLLSRVLFGAQISLLVGIVGAVVSLVIGVIWGAVAGYAGG